MFQKFERIKQMYPIQFSNGVKVFNCTANDIKFLDGGVGLTVRPCGVKIKTVKTMTPYTGEQPLYGEFVTPKFEPKEGGMDSILELKAIDPDALIIGSCIDAQAYRGIVATYLPAKGRIQPDGIGKYMRVDKFEMY
jgi:hypothetical protein